MSDGLTDLLFSPSDWLLLESRWRTAIAFFPDVSLTNQGSSLIGYHEPDAFQRAQTFEWQYKGNIPRKHLLGFCEMLDISLRHSKRSPCMCEREACTFKAAASDGLSMRDLVEDKQLDPALEALRTLSCFEKEKLDNFN